MSSAEIHPLSVVEQGATIGDGCRIGPFCHIGPEVVLGDGVTLVGHVTILGATTIGAGTIVHPNAVLGGPGQSSRHKGGRVTLEIGSNCTIREFVTMNLGTDMGRGKTVVGNNGNFLAYAHIAHDCIVGDNVTFANGATLGGHCEVGNKVNIGGLTAVHQFVRIGDQAFIGGAGGVVGDVIPYAIAVGNRAKLRGLNLVGLKRSGMPRDQIFALRRAYKAIFDPARPVVDNVEQVRRDFDGVPSVMAVVDFLTSRGKRHLATPLVRGVAVVDDDEPG